MFKSRKEPTAKMIDEVYSVIGKAIAGIADAQYRLGQLYEEGGWVHDAITNTYAANLDEARRWYSKAANKNHEPAKNALERLNNPPVEQPAHVLHHLLLLREIGTRLQRWRVRIAENHTTFPAPNHPTNASEPNVLPPNYNDIFPNGPTETRNSQLYAESSKPS